MPIKPENLKRYPPDWPDISRRIRFERAGGRCECRGECGRHGPGTGLAPDGRCIRVHGEFLPSGNRVVLTTAHLNHTPEDCRDENLKAWCQGCHLYYDRDHHAATRKATREQLASEDGG